MLFNSAGFVVFLPVVFVLYWFVTQKSLKFQNILLLIASYFFYACWDYRFLFLLIFSTLLDFYTGIKMGETKNLKARKFWFLLSVIINVGLLFVFKYYNFFQESFIQALSVIGIHTNLWTLKIILPIGISFYTFHGLSYVIDIYKEKIKPSRNFIEYAVFVGFFPLLVAGPIERATHLLPQIQKKRVFKYIQAVDGLKQILWGLFKKMVVADGLASFVNIMFSNYHSYSGIALLLGAICFAFQIYADFSGYSDIAIGTAKLFGIDLLRNFSYPYFSRDIAEFWRRWHISLTSWFKDYIYIPLGGSRVGTWKKVRNIFIIFILSGFWHGANWTFIVWGVLNALYFLPLLLLHKNRDHLDIVAKEKYLPTFKEFFSMGVTFSLTVLAWIFFRANSVRDALFYISRIFFHPYFSFPESLSKRALLIALIFFIVEWLGREQPYAIANFGTKYPKVVRWIFYYLILIVIFLFGVASQQFIYFQF